MSARSNGVKVRKLRGDSKLSRLTAPQKAAVVAWLTRENAKLDDVAARIERQFGIKTSSGALSNFWNRYVSPKLLTGQLQQIALDNDTLAAVVVEWKGGRLVTRHFQGPASKK